VHTVRSVAVGLLVGSSDWGLVGGLVMMVSFRRRGKLWH